MKLMIFTFFLLLHVALHAQKKPTQAEINKAKQSQAAMQKEMDKELKELEADDPEMAKRIREMMKQQGQPVKQSASAAVPKFVSPITPINVKHPITPPTEAQATDHLLWYKGKKVSKNILITQEGMLVEYKPQKNEVVVQPDAKKDPFKKMVSELANTEKRKADLISNIAKKKNSFFYYPALINTLKEYDEASSDYHKILKNTIQLPSLITSSRTYKTRSIAGGYASFTKNFSIIDIPEAIRKAHDEALALMKNYPSIDFPDPPARDFSMCYDCDSTVSKAYRRQLKKWEDEFSAYEVSVAQKAVSVIQALSIYGLEKDPEGIKMNANMERVLQFAMNRTRNKVDMLQRKYSKDFTRLPVVIQKTISYEREKQLLGASDSSNAAFMDKVISLLEGFDTYIQEQMEQKNYNVVLNLAFLLGIERQKQLLGASDNNNVESFDKFMSFNRFRLSIDMDASVESEIIIADAGATTTKDVYISLGYNKCRLQGFLSSADYREGQEYDFRIPMTAKGGVKKQKDENDEWVSYNYSGPKDLLGLFPVFSISFCNDGMDSVFLQIPINKYENMNAATAQSVIKAYTIDHAGYLAMLVIKGTEEAAEEGSEIAEEVLKTYSANHHEKSTGNATLDQLQHEYNLALKTKELQDKMSTAINQNSLLVLFDAQNKEDVVIDAETKPSHSMDDFSVKGKVKIKVVHDPLPYEAPKTVKQ